MSSTAVTFNDLQATEFWDRGWVSMTIGDRPGNIYYVNSNNGSSSNSGTTAAGPKATLAQAVALCTPSKNDVVVVLPGHTETLATTTAGITISTSGITIIGCGNGRNRPAITAGAADIVGVLLSGSNCRLKNLRFIGSTSQTTATSALISVTGTDNTIEGCVFEHGGAGPLRAANMTGATRTVWKDCKFIGTAAGPDVGIFITSASLNSEFRNLLFQYVGSSGLDSGAIKGSAGVATSDSIFEGCRAFGMDATLFDINGSHASISVGDSIMINNAGIASAGVAIANFIDAGGNVLMGNWIADAIASPAIATGAVGAITTVSQRVPAGSPVT